MRRAITLLVILAVVAGGGWYAYNYVNRPVVSAGPDYEMVKVRRGTIVSTVSSTGTIVPQAQLSLSFKTPGRVAKTLVERGDVVKQNQVLAQLETTDLELALAQAQVSLQMSQARLNQLKAPANESDLASARAAVVSAASQAQSAQAQVQSSQAQVQSSQAQVQSGQAQLASAQANRRQIEKGSTPDELAAAAANLKRAQIARDQAQQAYDKVATQPNVGLLPQSLQLQQTTADYETALAQYRVQTAGAKDNQVAQAQAAIAQAQATIAQATAGISQASAGIAQARAGITQAEASQAQAQAQLDRLVRGAAAEDIAVAEAQVKQSEVGVQQAQLALDNARLIAPRDAVVTAVSIGVGEIPSGARPAISLADLSRFHVDINVDEVDIGQMQVGQEATVTLDAFPSAELKGQVRQIAPSATVDSSGVSNYVVTIDVTPESANAVQLRSGLSANAKIVSGKVENTLIAPNRAIQIDRATGKAYVEVVRAGAPVKSEIQTGTRNDSDTQILAGLNESDDLAIRDASARDQLRQSITGQ